MIRMILADDEPVTRMGLQSLKWEEDGLEVVGIAANGLEALELIHSHKPDLFLTDRRMPGLDGLTLMEQLKTENRRIQFVFITAYHQLDYALAAIKLGASGFVLKPTDPEEIIQACKKAKQFIDEERARIAMELGLRNQVKAFSFTLQDMLVSEKEVSRWSEVTLQIMHYIELNYIHEMNITVVAETLHYHPDYLSRLFKKETGENFSDTLTRVRMKKAIDLLADPQIKIYEIADRVISCL